MEILGDRFQMDPPTKPERFLSCYLETFTTSIQSMKPVLDMSPETLVRGESGPTPRLLPNPLREGAWLLVQHGGVLA